MNVKYAARNSLQKGT